MSHEDISHDQLALLIKQGFDHVDSRFEALEEDVSLLKQDVSTLKNDMRDVKYRLVEVAYRFEFKELEDRVDILEKR